MVAWTFLLLPPRSLCVAVAAAAAAAAAQPDLELLSGFLFPPLFCGRVFYRVPAQSQEGREVSLYVHQSGQQDWNGKLRGRGTRFPS